jgi:hypothetical protein
VRHWLIKALSKFKLSKVPHLSPFSRHESSSSFEAIVVQPKENRVPIDRGKLNSSLGNQTSKWSEIC